jgi:hypothetical protein
VVCELIDKWFKSLLHIRNASRIIYAELFNFEGNVESAFSKWLADQLLEVREQLGVETLPDDYIGVTMALGGVTGHYNPSPGGAANPTYDQYEFDLDL